MKKTLLLFFLLICLSTAVQADRSIDGFTSFEQYREQGDYRLWTFIVKDSILGTYISEVKEAITIDGHSGRVIEQKLKLDYNKLGVDYKADLIFDISNRHFVADNGMYLGDNMQLNINGQSEKAELERSGSILKGFTTRNGNEIPQEIELHKIKNAVEINYIDQLELYLASLDITVGTEINDTIFMSQSLVESFIYGFVRDYKNVQLYNKVFDSSFVIELMYPTPMIVYFTPDKRLVKLDIPSQNLKIYQDAVRNPLKLQAAAKQLAERKKGLVQSQKSIPTLIIAFVLYLIAGIIIVLFFIKKLYKKTITYIILGIGGLSYIIIPFTQIPLQQYLFTNYFVPHVLKAGESAILWGILPALTAGVIQEILLFFVLLFSFKYLKVKDYDYLSLGAVIGLGFGVIEAISLAYGTPTSVLFGINLVERIFLIIFHISAAVCLSYGLKEGNKKLISLLLITIVLNSAMRYLPIFVQEKVVTPELLSIMLAFISILFLTSIVFITKKSE